MARELTVGSIKNTTITPESDTTTDSTVHLVTDEGAEIDHDPENTPMESRPDMPEDQEGENADMGVMKTLATDKSSGWRRKKVQKLPANHRHHCPVHKKQWLCADERCDRVPTKICEECMTARPRTPNPHGTSLGEVLGLKPDAPALDIQGSPVVSTRDDDITTNQPVVKIMPPAKPAKSPKLAKPSSGNKPEKTTTAPVIGKDGAKLFARAWNHGKGYIPIIVLRPASGGRFVIPVGEPCATKQTALDTAEILRNRHVADNTLPQKSAKVAG